jgi:hypothetical protein
MKIYYPGFRHNKYDAVQKIGMLQTMEDKWKHSRIIYWAFKIINETCDIDNFTEFGATARQVDYSDVFTESYNLYG